MHSILAYIFNQINCRQRLISFCFGSLAALLCLTRSELFAQPDIELLRFYNGNQNRNDGFMDVYHRADGGYFVCGFSNQTTLVMRLEENGDVVWSRSGDYDGTYYSVIETDDGNLLVGGEAGNTFIATYRNGENGDRIWSTFCGTGACYAVIELKSGDFALAGVSRRNFPATVEAYLTMISGEDGRQLWAVEEEQQGSDKRRFMALRESEGGIVVSGDDYPNGLLSKYDFEERLIWSRSFDLGNERVLMTSMVSRPGGFAIGGYGWNPDENDYRDNRLTLVDNEGENANHILYPSAGRVSDYCWAIGRCSDGGFVLAGETIDHRNQPSLRAFRMIRTRNNGDLVWRTRFDTLEFADHQDRILSVIVQEDDRIVACGQYYNAGIGNQDGILIRLFSDQLGPILFYRFPEDSLIEVLRGDSIQFIARARNRNNDDLFYQWFLDEQVIARDDTVKNITFDRLGEYTVSCRISDQDAAVSVTWHVTVTDLYIQSHSPDTLHLTVRRGSSVDFSLDTVRYTEGIDPQYQWTIFPEQEDAGRDARATVEFSQMGNYAVEGLVYRGESSDAVVWNVAVRGAVWSFNPEQLSLYLPLNSSQEFEVTPFDPDSDSLSYQWLYNDDVLADDSTTSSYTIRFGGEGAVVVKAVVTDGVEADTVTWEVTVRELSTPPAPPSIEGGDYPAGFGLKSVSPNPFNSMLTIRYSFAAINSGKQRLSIYDLSGREVARLGRDEGWGMRDEGAATSPAVRLPQLITANSVTWNASSVPAGVYLVRLQAGSEVSTKKVVLIR